MDVEQLAENRRQLARLARQKKKRRVPRELPCDWRPGTVTNPEGNEPFTEAAAWGFIAQLLEDLDGQEVEVLPLDRPPDKLAYVMQRPMVGGKLYIKVHYGHGPSILGRSFHYSDYGTQP